MQYNSLLFLKIENKSVDASWKFGPNRIAVQIYIVHSAEVQVSGRFNMKERQQTSMLASRKSAEVAQELNFKIRRIMMSVLIMNKHCH